MVNMPINVSTFPTDELGLVTDINQNINQEYYEWLLKQHNYFPDCAFHKEKFEDTIKMEHSYTRDWKPTSNNEIMATRTILIERPPLCPSCHQLPPNHDEKVDTPEAYNIPIPPYNEEAGRTALNATEEMIKSCHNRNSDTEDWTETMVKTSWTDQQLNLFERVERILDMDQLGRLAIAGLSNECLRRNAIIEKSVSRFRSALASVHWEPRLTTWLHGLLMIHLPSNYMVSYIDILQTLKRKIPTLVDKMLYHSKPNEMHKDYMSAIMKRSWEPAMVTKTRTLPSNPVIVLVSSSTSAVSSRDKRWLELLSTLTSVETTAINLQAVDPQKPIEQVTEQLITITRAKIQEIRNRTPNRHIILAGFNAGAAIALQVALVEPVNSIVCLGFAFNTLTGVRGNPDDRILDLTTPVLFVIGQCAQRSSQEEIESLRERMNAQTLLVVVGSSDDALRVKRLNRSMEGVSQSMIDNMIMDEIQEFASSCILHPPGPRKRSHLNGNRKPSKQRASPIENGLPIKRKRLNGSQKIKVDRKPMTKFMTKTKHIQNGMDDASLQLAFESILPPDVLQNGDKDNGISHENNVMLKSSPSIRQKVKYIPANFNQFVHIKPPPINTQKIYVKQQNGNQSYTLGVKNISTTDNLPAKNNSIAVKHKDECKHVDATDMNGTESALNVTEPDSDMDDINIFDIPILFADNDGNILENQIGIDSPKRAITPEPEPEPDSYQQPQKRSNMIEILSEEIISGPTIENGSTFDRKMKNTSPSTPSKPVTHSERGNFLVLNKSTLSQMKTVKEIRPGKLKKVLFPSRNSTIQNCVPASSIVSENGNLTSGVKVNVQRFQNFTRLSPSQNEPALQTNGRPKSPKSGILIKRNHLKNITVRKLSVVQSTKTKDTESHHKNNGKLSESTETTVNNSKDDSLNNLIADLES